jgi:hypothetical protein
VKKYGTARQATDDNIIRRMRFVCWITKATDTHSECVTIITFSRQQWLRERASVLRYTYTASLVAYKSHLKTYMQYDSLQINILFIEEFKVELFILEAHYEIEHVNPPQPFKLFFKLLFATLLPNSI